MRTSVGSGLSEIVFLVGESRRMNLLKEGFFF